MNNTNMHKDKAKPRIIFEDDYLIVLDKPAGWIVNEAATTGKTPVVQSWLAQNFKYQISNDKVLRSGIVHRLDKETSGILLVVKTLDSFKNLQAQFKGRKVEKTYVALVHGKVEPKEGNISVPVGRLPWNRMRFGVLAGGREAVTEYRVISHYSQHITKPTTHYSLLSLFPKTGRTHQIRIHLKYIGHPIVSDEFYAGRKTARADRKWCPRLFLHAEKISFNHPQSAKKLSFKSGLPNDLQNCLDKLELLQY